MNQENVEMCVPVQMRQAAQITSKKRKLSLKTLTPYLCIAPVFVVFSAFLFFPFLRTVFLSLFLTNSLGEATVFKGLGNYVRLFQSDIYLSVLKNTVIFAALFVIGPMVLGFVTANLANIKGRPFKIFPLLFTMPIAASAGAFSLLFEKMLDPTTGIINKLLHANVRWFQEPSLALFSIILISIWLVSGHNFLYMYAGLRNVPKDILESAEIDGATGFTKLFRITVPCMSPMLFFILITDIIASFQVFTQINVITQGGPGNETTVMVYSIYRDAFFNFRFGPAAAESVVLFLIILVITLVQFKYEKKLVHYA